jgi:cAMP-specific phosphodiesterase 4
MYLINSKDELAILYNDKSILENHHVSYTFKLLEEKDCEIFENISQVDRKDIRKKMINSVLCTDLSVHFYELGNCKTKIKNIGNIS